MGAVEVHGCAHSASLTVVPDACEIVDEVAHFAEAVGAGDHGVHDGIAAMESIAQRAVETARKQLEAYAALYKLRAVHAQVDEFQSSSMLSAATGDGDVVYVVDDDE